MLNNTVHGQELALIIISASSFVHFRIHAHTQLAVYYTLGSNNIIIIKTILVTVMLGCMTKVIMQVISLAS